MVKLDRVAVTVEVKEEVKEEGKEDRDAETDKPPFYLPKKRTVS